ncbi:MAG: sugar phosphate isomerase/epimerase, partial [Pseudomonadota bacterium]
YSAPSGLAAMLGQAGLKMPSGHFGLAELENKSDELIGAARQLEIQSVYCPFLDGADRPDTKSGWHEFGARLQKIGEPYRAAGLRFGWHNHDFEFQPTEDGAIPMHAILEGGPDLSWEADIAWIVRGGADPVDWIERYGNRISAVHVKDIASPGECADEDGWADVGYGTMDWPAIFSALKSTPCQLYVVEHDNPNDDERFARRSYEKISEMLK